jgi:hypothetical protein
MVCLIFNILLGRAIRHSALNDLSLTGERGKALYQKMNKSKDFIFSFGIHKIKNK